MTDIYYENEMAYYANVRYLDQMATVLANLVRLWGVGTIRRDVRKPQSSRNEPGNIVLECEACQAFISVISIVTDHQEVRMEDFLKIAKDYRGDAHLQMRETPTPRNLPYESTLLCRFSRFLHPYQLVITEVRIHLARQFDH